MENFGILELFAKLIRKTFPSKLVVLVYLLVYLLVYCQSITYQLSVTNIKHLFVVNIK